MQAVTLDCMKGQPSMLTCVRWKLEGVDTVLLKCMAVESIRWTRRCGHRGGVTACGSDLYAQRMKV
eukprot:6455789-Amphidinium_carterae.1